ncbi:Rna exonuclease, partial [Thalictrum thalictroides]
MEADRGLIPSPLVEIVLSTPDQAMVNDIPIQVAEKALQDGEKSPGSSSSTQGQQLQGNGWANLFKNAKGEKFTADLSFCHTNVVDGVAKCPGAILAKGETEWNDLVGFFMGRRLAYPIVKEALAKQWKIKGSYDIATDDEFFYFKFTDGDDKRMILEKGPIFIAGRIFIVKPWSKSIDTQKKQIKSIPIWVTIYGLPKCLWTTEGLSYVGSLLGQPMCADEATTNKSRLSFAKICVEVTSVAELPNSLPIDIGEAQPVVVQF